MGRVNDHNFFMEITIKTKLLPVESRSAMMKNGNKKLAFPPVTLFPKNDTQPNPVDKVIVGKFEAFLGY